MTEKKNHMTREIYEYRVCFGAYFLYIAHEHSKKQVFNNKELLKRFLSFSCYEN